MPRIPDLILDSVSDPLNVAAAPFVLGDLKFTPAEKVADLVTSPGFDGGALRTRPDNTFAYIEGIICVANAETASAAVTKLREVSSRLDECELTDGGLPVKWAPDSLTANATTWYALLGQLVELPMESAWYAGCPIATFRLTCEPFGVGAWQNDVATVTGTAPILAVEIPNVLGDVDAEGKLVITDGATKDRHHYEWGLEWQNYNPASPGDYILSDGDITRTGYLGSSGTEAGSYSTNTTEGSVYTTPATFCAILAQPHTGPKLVKIRCLSSAPAGAVQIRLAWQVGDGYYVYNDWVETIGTGVWMELDLGYIDIPVASGGTQSWSGLIQAYADETRSLVVDYVEVIPVERYGKAQSPGALQVADSFTLLSDFTTESGGLSGDSLLIGGTWSAGSGDADTFSVAGGVANRTALNDSFAGAGIPRRELATTAPGDNVTVRTEFSWTAPPASGSSGGYLGVIARYVNTSNYLIGALYFGITTAVLQINLRDVGVDETLAASSLFPMPPAGTIVSLALSVNQQGLVSLTWEIDGVENQITGSDPDLVAGGSHASGQAGIVDYWASATASTRTFYIFSVSESIETGGGPVVSSGRTAILTHERAERYDSAGTVLGRVPVYRGGRVWIPPAGERGRTSRLLSKLRANDVDAFADDDVNDSHTVTVSYRPRYRFPN